MKEEVTSYNMKRCIHVLAPCRGDWFITLPPGDSNGPSPGRLSASVSTRVCGSSEVYACVLGSTSAAFRSERIGVLLSGIRVKVLYNCKKTASFFFFFF